MTDLPDEETIRVRRTGGVRDEAAPARHRETFVDADGHEQTDGSTIVARRESRRRAARDQAGTDVAASPVAERTPPPVVTTSEGRLAVVPEPAAGVRYNARGAEPVVVARAAPPARRAQEPIDAIVTAVARRRTARRTAFIVVIAASAVALGAVAILVLIALGT